MHKSALLIYAACSSKQDFALCTFAPMALEILVNCIRNLSNSSVFHA